MKNQYNFYHMYLRSKLNEYYIYMYILIKHFLKPSFVCSFGLFIIKDKYKNTTTINKYFTFIFIFFTLNMVILYKLKYNLKKVYAKIIILYLNY